MQNDCKTMLGKLILIMMLLCISVSAEIIKSGDYNFRFNVNRPHVIEGNELKTFDGWVVITPTAENATDPDDVPYIGGVGRSFDINRDPQSGLYFCTPHPGKYYITSSLNLTDTIDFLKSLKVEKAKTYALPYPTPAETFTLSKKEAVKRAEKDIEPLNFSM